MIRYTLWETMIGYQLLPVAIADFRGLRGRYDTIFIFDVFVFNNMTAYNNNIIFKNTHLRIIQWYIIYIYIYILQVNNNNIIYYVLRACVYTEQHSREGHKTRRHKYSFVDSTHTNTHSFVGLTKTYILL